ncbi:MAG TPA: DUF2283 domain-containing protein [bacterium]|nr:DUF2283 domain-containing protein [bacterium]
MKQGYNITYDRAANALYIYLRGVESVSQREFSEDIILDLGEDGGLVGIEVLDPGADLSRLVGEFGLDPHLLSVVDTFRKLIPDTRKQLALT